MKTFICSLAILSFIIACQNVLAARFEWSLVGNPGNPADARTGYGAVGYSYRIGKYEVTNSQYAEFLNAVAATDTYNLYSDRMTIDTRGGIVRNGLPGSYSYTVKPDAVGMAPGGANYTYRNKPVGHVSISDAMRFANWLHNGRPTGMQTAATTEDGAYSMSDAILETRNSNAKFFVTSEDEWYKAAYHKNDGATANYWLYPTANDTAPNNNLPTADTGNSANFDYDRSIVGNTLYPLTDAGAFTLSASSYGTFDQGGNVYEWNESIVSLAARGRRGGDWIQSGDHLLSTDRSWSGDGFQSDYVGFRVAAIVPEPSAVVLISSVIGCFASFRRHRSE